MVCFFIDCIVLLYEDDVILGLVMIYAIFVFVIISVLLGPCFKIIINFILLMVVIKEVYIVVYNRSS